MSLFVKGEEDSKTQRTENLTIWFSGTLSQIDASSIYLSSMPPVYMLSAPPSLSFSLVSLIDGRF